MEMKKDRITTPELPQVSKVVSHAVKYGNIVAFSGQPGKTSSGSFSTNIEDQVRQSLENLKKLVESAGGTLDNIIRCECFLVNGSDFSLMNKVYSEYFGSLEIPPARYTILVNFAKPEILFEVSAIAVL